MLENGTCCGKEGGSAKGAGSAGSGSCGGPLWGAGSRLWGLRCEEAGRGVARTCGNSLPVVSVFSVKLFPMTQNMVWFVGLVLYNWFRFSFAEAH